MPREHIYIDAQGEAIPTEWAGWDRLGRLLGEIDAVIKEGDDGSV